MDYRTGKIGRIFWARIDHDDDLRESILELARKEKVGPAVVLALGALSKGEVVLGPRETTVPPEPVWKSFTKGREIMGVGTILEAQGRPALHLHVNLGRNDEPTLTGCLRGASRVYLVVEAVIIEVDDLAAARVFDPETELELPAFLD